MKLKSLAFSIIPTITITIISAASAFAWGPEGHEIVALVAQRYLTPTTQAKVNSLLGSGVTMASVASWADQIRSQRPETAGWHFIDIPLDATSIDFPTLCANDNCVVNQINLDLAILSGQTAGNQQEALQFLIHFTGDVHQPLHSSDNGDRGGNNVHVSFLGRHDNLHRVWDSSLLNDMEDRDQLVADIENQIDALGADQRQAMVQGAPADWALEAHQAAVSSVYNDQLRTAGNKQITLDEDYERIADPIVELQLERAGYRLASLLNETFDPPPAAPSAPAQ